MSGFGRLLRLHWLAFAVLATALHAASSLAYSAGINGYSGKFGVNCNSCHSGGTAPVAMFQGPGQVAAGTIATFRFIVQSQATTTQTFAGLNVAASGGLLAAGEGQYVLLGEITHLAPQANDAQGMASWDFTWQAPATPGAYTVFGSGNSVNHDGTQIGDRAASTTLTVTVEAAAATPTVMPTPTPTATPVSTGLACVGDCNDDGTVSIDELLTGVEIALRNVALTVCPAFDENGDGAVTIDELLAAVSDALNGCPR